MEPTLSPQEGLASPTKPVETPVVSSPAKALKRKAPSPIDATEKTKTLAEENESHFDAYFRELVSEAQSVLTTKTALHASTAIRPQLAFLTQYMIRRQRTIYSAAMISNRTARIFPQNGPTTQQILLWGMMAELNAFVRKHYARFTGPSIPERNKLEIPSDVATLIGSLVPLPPKDGRPGLFVDAGMLDGFFQTPLVKTGLGAYAQIPFDHLDTLTEYRQVVRVLTENKHLFSIVHDFGASLLGTGVYDINTARSVVCAEDLASHHIPLAVTLRLYEVVRRNPQWLQPRVRPGNEAITTHLTTTSFYQPIEANNVEDILNLAMQFSQAATRVTNRT
jgi:hypothetical protein